MLMLAPSLKWHDLRGHPPSGRLAGLQAPQELLYSACVSGKAAHTGGTERNLGRRSLPKSLHRISRMKLLDLQSSICDLMQGQRARAVLALPERHRLVDELIDRRGDAVQGHELRQPLAAIGHVLALVGHVVAQELG